MIRPELQMPGGTLRPLRADDAEAIAQACAHSDIGRWTQIPQPYRIEDAREFIAAKGHEDHVWAIDVDGLVGVIGVRDTRATLPGPVARVGYWVAPQARGRGVATAALTAVRDELARAGYQRIDWEAIAGNAASVRVARKAGFGIEGRRRQALVQRGRLVDSIVGGWTRDYDVPELVAGQWQLQPVAPSEVPDELQPLASCAMAVWVVRTAVGGHDSGHVLAVRSLAGVHIVNAGADAAAAGAAARYATSVDWQLTDEPLPADWL